MSPTAKVLVIDDDLDFVEFARITLEAGGYHVLCARQGNHGLSLMRTEHPDLVLLDILMSYSMEGLEVMRAMNREPELSSIPLVVISSILTDTDIFQGQESLPIAAFRTKPIEPSELLRLAAQIVSPGTE